MQPSSAKANGKSLHVCKTLFDLFFIGVSPDPNTTFTLTSPACGGEFQSGEDGK
jgi:hypothetical protein